jgi:NAD(P)-dependent dehydrogenase (short-subunit alcohol dehydrogenase family)
VKRATRESAGRSSGSTTRTAQGRRRYPPSPKGGLVAATRSLAIEYASRGVRVNAVSLGVIKTPAHDPASYTPLTALHPLGRVGEVSDVVDAILYLERRSAALQLDLILRWLTKVPPAYAG